MVGKRSSRALIGRNPVRNEAQFRPSSLRFGGGVRGPQRLDLSCEAQDEGGGGSSARPRGHPAASGSLRAQWAHADVGSGPRRDLGWIWVQAYRLSAVVGLTQARIHRRDLRARRPASGRLQISDPRIGRGSWAHSNACADPIGLRSGEHASLRCDTWGQAIGGGGGASSSIARRGWLSLRQGRHRGSCAVRHFSDRSPGLRSERIVWRPLTTCPRRQREAPRRPCLPRSRHPPPWRRSCSLPPESRARPVLPTVLGRRTCRRRRRETHPAGR